MINWYGCYRGSSKGIIHDEAFSHPAKMPLELTRRIFRLMFERGWLEEGDLVADPFGGIGMTNIVASAYGCPSISVELEQKFVDLADKSFTLHLDEWRKMGKPIPVMIQGDSRQFSKVVWENISGIVTSPPFSTMSLKLKDPEKKQQIINRMRLERGQIKGGIGRSGALGRSLNPEGYGETNGQLGTMQEGNYEEVIGGIVTSPPYSEQPIASIPGGDQGKIWKQTGLSIRQRSGGKLPQEQYGGTKGQLGAMEEGSLEEAVQGIITSPPYSEIRQDGGSTKEGYVHIRPYSDEPRITWRTQRDQENLGNLPEGSQKEIISGIVTSPPYERSLHERKNDQAQRSARLGHEWKGQRGSDEYSTDPTNIGNQEKNTYWQAVAQVYFESWKTLRANGVIAIVVKPFVRKGKLVDLPKQTEELLEALGFKIVEKARAWLVSEATQKALIPGVADRRKEHKSFFRRLAEKKGAPPINYETVLFAQKVVDG